MQQQCYEYVAYLDLQAVHSSLCPKPFRGLVFSIIDAGYLDCRNIGIYTLVGELELGKGARDALIEAFPERVCKLVG